ncbi:ankyrin repeat-containing domain protein, partial [Colletotrichum cereale]
TAMHIAARLGHVGVVEALLRHGAPVDARDGRGETPLHLAVDKGHGKVRDFLVERGAD